MGLGLRNKACGPFPDRRETLVALAAAAALVLPVWFGAAAADAASGGSAATSQQTTATAQQTTTAVPQTTTSPTNLLPTIAPSPALKLISLARSGDRVEVRLACVFAACDVTAVLTTIEHLRSGSTTSLSASGHGRDTRTVEVGLGKLRILPGKTIALTVKPTATGLRLLQSFASIPTEATIELTNGDPVKTIRRIFTLS